MIVEPDNWLGTCLGCSAYKVILAEETVPLSTSLPVLSYHVRKIHPAFYWVKVPTSQVALLHEFCKVGFQVVDVSITLVRERSEVVYLRPHGVAPAQPGDFSKLLEIAGSFECSRFHLDPLIPSSVADDIKQAWLGSYLAGERGEKLLVAFRNGEPVGFLAVLSDSWDGKPARTVDLIAVSPDERGKGVAKRLISYLLSLYPWSAVKVGTQAANVASLCLYEAMEFRVVQTEYVLHLHVPALPSTEWRLTDPDFENMMR